MAAVHRRVIELEQCCLRRPTGPTKHNSQLVTGQDRALDTPNQGGRRKSVDIQGTVLGLCRILGLLIEAMQLIGDIPELGPDMDQQLS